MSDAKTIFVTGGAGFIGGALVKHLFENTSYKIVNIDKLTYASQLPDIAPGERYVFEKIDICDAEKVNAVFQKYQPQLVMHLAAESHVDRSISGPLPFIQSNIVGTYTLLEAARAHHETIVGEKKSAYRKHHVSTDEVWGSGAG